ncbi:MAG: hypothetical protein AAF732_14960 [Pseudomonadota bacterium]
MMKPVRLTVRSAAVSLAFVLAVASVVPASAQSSWRDGITEFLVSGKAESGTETKTTASGETTAANTGDKDPRSGDKNYEQARRLMQAIDAILNDAARNRDSAKKLPSKDDFLVPPMFTETREDRENYVRELLDSALGIVTDVPVVDIQKEIERRRKEIAKLNDQIAVLKERMLTAPKDSLLPGVLADTVASLKQEVADLEERIAQNQKAIDAAKTKIRKALADAGIKMEKSQIDMLVDSVLSGDLIRLVAVFNSAKLIDKQLAARMKASGENMTAARKYFAMHAALFAMLLRAQDVLIEKIDTQYLPKLDAIMRDIKTARERTKRLLRKKNRPDQKRVLEANLSSQKLAEDAARGYRRYLLQQRAQIAGARSRAAHDLRIADNTYETVEASFQLRTLMRESANTFEALQKLEAPTFEEIFRNEELRREFESLTKKLEAPTS